LPHGTTRSRGDQPEKRACDEPGVGGGGATRPRAGTKLPLHPSHGHQDKHSVTFIRPRAALERSLRMRKPAYVAFDLLWPKQNGTDLHPLPLSARRRRLQDVLPRRSRDAARKSAKIVSNCSGSRKVRCGFYPGELLSLKMTRTLAIGCGPRHGRSAHTVASRGAGRATRSSLRNLAEAAEVIDDQPLPPTRRLAGSAAAPAIAAAVRSRKLAVSRSCQPGCQYSVSRWTTGRLRRPPQLPRQCRFAGAGSA
jgi:hypothetical protein